MSTIECAVVGGSFSGSYCARELARRGVETAVLEEHSKPGKFHKCSGLFSKKGLDALGVSHGKTVLNEVNGARIIAGNAIMQVKRKGTVAIVCDRQALDEQIAREAQDAGATFALDAHAEKITANNGKQSISSTDGRNFRADYVIGADGASSAVARQMGFPPIPASDFVLAYEGEFAGCAISDAKLVDVVLDADLFPGFFGWVIPVNQETARIGFGTRNFPGLGESKKRFFNLPEIRGIMPKSTCRLCRDFSHVIPLAVRGKTQIGNVLLVGDAAGQVKATTGGGIVFNGQCAKIAAEEIAANKIEGKSLDYERKWRKKLGRSLKAHRIIRDIYNLAPNSFLSPALALANTLGISSLISAHGDMDYIVT